MRNNWYNLPLTCFIITTLVFGTIVVKCVLLPKLPATQSWDAIDSIEQVYGTWKVEKYEYPNGTYLADIPQKEYFGISFHEHNVLGIYSNCNHISAKYTYTAPSHIVHARITAMTEVGCEGSFETEFIHFLDDSYLSLETNGTILKVTNNQSNIALHFSKET